MQLADITMPDDFPLLPSSLNVTNQIATLIVSALEKKGRSNTTGATEVLSLVHCLHSQAYNISKLRYTDMLINLEVFCMTLHAL